MVPVKPDHAKRWLWAAVVAAGGGLIVTSLTGRSEIVQDLLSWASLGLAVIAILLFSNEQSQREEDRLQGEGRMKLLQEDLERQRQNVDALGEGMDVAILVCDERATISYANRAAKEMFRTQDPAGRSLLAITLNYDLEQLALLAGRDRKEQNAELTFAYPTDRVGLAKAWSVESLPGRVFVTVVEITDLRRLERVRTDFVSNVSHELRTPLTLIRAMAETLLDDRGKDKELFERYLGKVIEEVDRLSGITSDLLTLSSAESNPVRKAPCDLVEVFSNVVNQFQSKAAEKGLELTFEGPEHLVIEANTAQMTQVAINLVDNAINYTQTGSVKVSVTASEDEAMVNVADTGIGIPSDHHQRVFERFYRVDRGRARTLGGTGLGLSIVKNIVESHGGEITVESALNRGSTFTVKLPFGASISES